MNLVPREEAPRGFQLVSADKVGKKNQFDLVELAAQVPLETNKFLFRFSLWIVL